ncbi:MFS transporter [Nocardia brasiliensis]
MDRHVQNDPKQSAGPLDAVPDLSGVAKFGKVFDLPGVSSFIVVAFAARIPAAGRVVVLTLHVVLALKLGYYEAGLVSAAYTVGRAFGAPLMGSLIDRCGLRTMLVVTTIAETLFWTASPSLPYGGLLAAAPAGGLLGIPIHAVIRQSLAAMVPQGSRRQAFSIDSMSIDLAYIIGPPLGVWLVLQWSSTTALRLLGLGCVALGSALWAMNRPTRVLVGAEARPAPARIGSSQASGSRHCRWAWPHRGGPTPCC